MVLNSYMKLSDKFEKLPGIYIIKNSKNGKVYIGESVNVQSRIRKHKVVTTQIIHKAFEKYGIENFDVYVEYFPDFKKKDLVELEGELIVKFNSLAPNGYNVLKEGSNWGGCKHSDETKKKMSDDRSGSKHPSFGKKWSSSQYEIRNSIKLEELDNIVDLYFNKMLSTTEIAKIYQVSHNSVYRFLKRNGKQPRKINEYIKPRIS